jgi:HEAT repeat protein
MSENMSIEPASPASGFETRPKGVRRPINIMRPLVLFVVFGGALLWAARLVWENRHPAVAAARGLTAGTPTERSAAVRDLTAAGITDIAVAIPRLTPAIRDADAGVRTAAVESLGLLLSYSIRSRTAETEARAAVSDLLGALKDTQPEVRIAAIHVLASVRTVVPSISRQSPKKAEAPVPLVDPKVLTGAMIAVLGDHDAGVRAAAVTSLSEVTATDPADGLPQSTLALADEDANVRRVAADAVGRLISQAIKTGKGQTEAGQAVPRLLAAVKDSQASVRGAAIGALTAIHAALSRKKAPRSDSGDKSPALSIDAATSATAFTGSLSDPNAEIQQAAVRGLRELEPSAIQAAAIPPLVAALKTGDSDLRYDVLELLSRLGSKAEPAIPAIIAALKEPAETDRAKVAGGAPVSSNALTGPAFAAAEALGKIAPRSPSASQAALALAEVVASGPTGRRPVAADALAEFGARAAASVPALVKMLRESEQSDAASDSGTKAASALGKIAPGTPSAALAVPALNEALKSKSAETRAAAGKALERFGPQDRQQKS